MQVGLPGLYHGSVHLDFWQRVLLALQLRLTVLFCQMDVLNHTCDFIRDAWSLLYPSPVAQPFHLIYNRRCIYDRFVNGFPVPIKWSILFSECTNIAREKRETTITNATDEGIDSLYWKDICMCHVKFAEKQFSRHAEIMNSKADY